jgi:2-oxoglutarate ferredoxin oxidoreductase subunit alpha
VLYGRIQQGAYREGTILLLENKWAKDPSPEIQAAYAEAVAMFRRAASRARTADRGGVP